MNERVGVDQLERGERNEQRIDVRADRFRSSNGEKRADALSAAENRVAHSLMNDAGLSVSRREVLSDRAFDARAAIPKVLIESHDSTSSASSSRTSSGSNGSVRGCPLASARI